jgi:hypothetical protein
MGIPELEVDFVKETMPVPVTKTLRVRSVCPDLGHLGQVSTSLIVTVIVNLPLIPA